MKEIKLLSKLCAFITKQSDLYFERKRIEYLKNIILMDLMFLNMSKYLISIIY